MLVAGVAVFLCVHPAEADAAAAEDRTAVVQAAERFTETWNTFRPKDAEEYVDRVSPLLTTKFREEFTDASQDVVTGIQQQDSPRPARCWWTRTASRWSASRRSTRTRPRCSWSPTPTGSRTGSGCCGTGAGRSRWSRSTASGSSTTSRGAEPRMSTPAGPPRRRQIAGERRPGRAVTPTTGDAPVDDGSPGVDLTKDQRVPPTRRRPPLRPHRHPRHPRVLRGRGSGQGHPLGDPRPWPGVPRGGARRRSSPRWPCCCSPSSSRCCSVPPATSASRRSRRRTRRGGGQGREDGRRRPPRGGAATSILAYDYRSLAATEKEATQFMTEDFATEYTETFEKVVVPAAKQQKAKVTA